MARKIIGLILFATLIAFVAQAPQGDLMVASGPCDDVNGAPDPPVPPTEPTWTGTVYNDNTNTGVSGATIRIYRCNAGTSTEVDDTTTDSSGDYSFTIAGGEYYYVQADLSGPLNGLTVASGYQNPTDAEGLGDSVDVDLRFE